MKRWNRLPFRTQIVFLYVGASIILLGTMAFSLFYSTSAIIRQEVANTTAASIEKSGRQLGMYIDDLKGFSNLLAQNPQVCRYFSASHGAEVGNLSDKEDIEALVASLLDVNPEIASIFLVGANGTLITNEANLDMEDTESLQEQEWYRAVLESEMPVLTSARMQEFSMDKEKWVISLGREIKEDAGGHIGVLRMDLHYDVIETILADLNLGKNGYAYILNKKDQVVYHEDSIYFTEEGKRQELLQMLDMPDAELNRGLMLLHQFPVANAEWLLVGIASLDGVARVQRDIILALWLTGSVLLVLALTGSSLLAGSLTRPLKKLEEAMVLVESGKMDKDYSVSGNAEVESLSLHFQSMLGQIRVLMEDVRSKEASLRKSELKALYSQINPHFLYNTLDTIVWLAELGQMDRVVHVSKSMARFFRLSLHGGSEWTTVREELDHVRQYLAIQQVRYGDALQYEIQAEEGLMDISIPKILLQPLVENALYHGLRKTEGPWLVTIAAKSEKEVLLLEVSDNGVGFDASVPVKRDEQIRLGGVGLQNIEERLRLHYGEAGTLCIESHPGQGTTVRLGLGKQEALSLDS